MDETINQLRAASVVDGRLLAEETVRPIPFFVIVILWLVALFFTLSTIASYRGLVLDFVPPKLRMAYGVCSILDVISLPLITAGLATCFTIVFFMFPGGVRYRIFPDRIEYQQGKNLYWVPFQKITFGEWQTLAFSELDSIHWVRDVGSDNPHDTTFIEFHFTSRTFQLHKSFALSGQVAEACRMIERETIAPNILRSIKDGKIVTFLRPDKYPSYEIEIDAETLRDWDQHRFSWKEICEIGFSKGKTTERCDFLAQSRIRIQNTSGETMEFDMPRSNPHAFWAVLQDRCTLPALSVLNFPPNERKLNPSAT